MSDTAVIYKVDISSKSIDRHVESLNATSGYLTEHDIDMKMTDDVYLDPESSAEVLLGLQMKMVKIRELIKDKDLYASPNDFVKRLEIILDQDSVTIHQEDILDPKKVCIHD